ncbi:thiamine pyrophosphate-dependent dehydrogenase E1 component subunit alpha [Zhongshania aquimaris]|uniref:Thiamine pyrophosphate-dependent dehydrogenase E1 component subunit alpha n=1 Tax=Zhongshania aquimaris TaxID=2857107 RepID=A0ABS6VW00_9GAMM|nr:thiamine pyrophosphate-dependent dehydrogenase E1 component subunit alpha [Zhongshania aquimaris]MBW2942514.1 thiamine pyrophosphate-dependent dehydrogenase E1 component subunit alpha [Zhongshania aquimaris]
MTTSASFTSKDLYEVYKKALKILIVDENIRGLIRSGAMHPVYYSPRGQEIVAAAMGVHLEPTDYLCTIYRGVHDQVAKGMPLDVLLAEYFMKVTGACKGKGGAMHITHPASGVMVTTGVVGSSMPIANGMAWASQIKGDDRVSVATFGDGASNIGAFHEALNMAAVWKLPTIFLCQNNRYQECTQYADSTSCEKISDRAAAYGPNMVGVSVDGNDAEEMWNAMRDAVARARSGAGPTLIEANTFRYMGHYFGDQAPYIPKEELAAEMAKDPMIRIRQQVLDSGVATEDDLVALKAELEAEFEAAVQFAKDSPEPELDEVYKDIYGAA